ncbi:MAG: ATP-binding protein [Atopobiaceae bacterium]|nr:ATP-binding protein [Atopobiaceae bacterium]
MTEHQTEDLTSFVAKMGGDRALRVEENLGQGFVRLRVAEAERRQAAHDIRCSEDIVIEMLRNSRDAQARHIFVATNKDGDERIITMLDDGVGIPHDLWASVFDARVTSKLESVHMDRWGVHGRGMALYSIAENAVSHGVIDSVVGGGTSIRVTSDTTRLSERSDQSSWPVTGSDDEGRMTIERGPHNILRTCCEFALEERGTCEVYVGSPAEMVATMRVRMRPSISNKDLLFLDDLSSLPICERFRVASDARELMQISQQCGLDISERTAHRIIAGQIKPLRSVMARLTHSGSSKGKRAVDLGADRRGLTLSKDDSQEFIRMMERDFAYLADRYYLTLSSQPRIRVAGNRLSVYFEYEGED